MSLSGIGKWFAKNPTVAKTGALVGGGTAAAYAIPTAAGAGLANLGTGAGKGTSGVAMGMLVLAGIVILAVYALPKIKKAVS